MSNPLFGKLLSEESERITICELSDEESEAIAGGIQPQPLPPGISSALRSDVLFVQPQPMLIAPRIQH